ncbi:MAG TPA: ATP-binding protein [Nocardioidaceae bacterium]|nr:ATP-binding protein [Nocardioidaceae bacterium]
MPLNLEAMPLEPDPASVRKARAWVREVLSRLQREDIVRPAELGVSELVTNAILHGTPPITVRVRGTRAHPRVEIRDASVRPPSVNVEMADEENLLATFGRGLGLVALHSAAWGAELTPEGKVVWFEPSDEPPDDDDLAGEVFDLDQTVQDRIAEAGLPDNPVRIRFVDLPVELYLKFRRRYYELGRELRLLALAHGHKYPVASELSEIFIRAEQERRLTRGIDQMERELASGREQATFELLVPETMPQTMTDLMETLERADQFCQEQKLLVLSSSRLEKKLQRWFFGEFARQAAGEAPLPWPGPSTDDDSDQTS